MLPRRESGGVGIIARSGSNGKMQEGREEDEDESDGRYISRKEWENTVRVSYCFIAVRLRPCDPVGKGPKEGCRTCDDTTILTGVCVVAMMVMS
jgi:hypothetical protein